MPNWRDDEGRCWNDACALVRTNHEGPCQWLPSPEPAGPPIHDIRPYLSAMKPRKGMWTIEAALEFITALEPYVSMAGYELALAGSVLKKRVSDKDLDIVVFPSTTEHQDLKKLYARLGEAGLSRVVSRDGVRKRWKREFDSNDEKHVEIWRDGWRRRIDFFFLK